MANHDSNTLTKLHLAHRADSLTRAATRPRINAALNSKPAPQRSLRVRHLASKNTVELGSENVGRGRARLSRPNVVVELEDDGA